MSEQSKAARMNGTGPSDCSAWRVDGDHPIGARPGKCFAGPLAEADAKAYAHELRVMGYENITVEPLPNHANKRKPELRRAVVRIVSR